MMRAEICKRVFHVAALGAMLFAVGCALGPDYQPPDIETPPEFRSEPVVADSVIDLRWWELFEDPILDSLVVTALDYNRDLQIAASRIVEARAFYGITRADILPRIDLEAGASRGDYAFGTKTETITENMFIAPTLRWELDFWGKFRRANEAARAELMATSFAHRTLQLGLISDVASTYFQLLDFHKRLEISRRTLASRLESLNIIQQRFDHGVVPEIDLNQAQIQREIAEGAIPIYERRIAKTEHTLSVLLGRLPSAIAHGDSLSRDTDPPEIPVGLPSDLLTRRPDIAEAEYLLRAQTARIGVAQAARLPSISLTGILGLASTDLTSFSDSGAWQVGGGLFGPLLDFGQAKNRVTVERERTKQALYNYQNTVLFAFRDVEDALIEIDTMGRELDAGERKFIAARSAAGHSRERYDKGVASYLEVLDSERTLFSVELELSGLRQQYRDSYVRLYKALGGGWATRDEFADAQQEADSAIAR